MSNYDQKEVPADRQIGARKLQLLEGSTDASGCEPLVYLYLYLDVTIRYGYRYITALLNFLPACV